MTMPADNACLNEHVSPPKAIHDEFRREHAPTSDNSACVDRMLEPGRSRLR
jgi:hypothetical protein